MTLYYALTTDTHTHTHTQAFNVARVPIFSIEFYLAILVKVHESVGIILLY